jgi:hypothetical protein
MKEGKAVTYLETIIAGQKIVIDKTLARVLAELQKATERKEKVDPVSWNADV